MSDPYTLDVLELTELRAENERLRVLLRKAAYQLAGSNWPSDQSLASELLDVLGQKEPS